MTSTPTTATFSDSLIVDENRIYPPSNLPYETIAENFFGLSFRVYEDGSGFVVATINSETEVIEDFESVDRREEANRVILTQLLERWHSLTAIHNAETSEIVTFPPPRIPSARDYKRLSRQMGYTPDAPALKTEVAARSAYEAEALLLVRGRVLADNEESAVDRLMDVIDVFSEYKLIEITSGDYDFCMTGGSPKLSGHGYEEVRNSLFWKQSTANTATKKK